MLLWYLLGSFLLACAVITVTVAVLSGDNIVTLLKDALKNEKPEMKDGVMTALIKKIESENGINKVSIDIFGKDGTRQCEVEVHTENACVRENEVYELI